MPAWEWNEDDPGEFDSNTNEDFKLRAVVKGMGTEWCFFVDVTRQSRFSLL